MSREIPKRLSDYSVPSFKLMNQEFFSNQISTILDNELFESRINNGGILFCQSTVIKKRKKAPIDVKKMERGFILDAPSISSMDGDDILDSFSPRDFFCLGLNDSVYVVFNINENRNNPNKFIRNPYQFENEIISCKISPSGKSIAVGHKKTVDIIYIERQGKVYRLHHEMEETPCSFAWTKNSELIMGSENGGIEFMDLRFLIFFLHFSDS